MELEYTTHVKQAHKARGKLASNRRLLEGRERARWIS